MNLKTYLCNNKKAHQYWRIDELYQLTRKPDERKRVIILRHLFNVRFSLFNAKVSNLCQIHNIITFFSFVWFAKKPKKMNIITIPSDAVAVSKLPKHFPQYKTSYIRHVLRHPEAPIFEQAGIRLISVSAFKNWYDWEYNGHFTQKYLKQLQSVRDYLITNTATRAQIEKDLRIRIPNICRIVAKIREASGAYRLEVVKRDTCPVTKHKAEFLRLVELKEGEEVR